MNMAPNVLPELLLADIWRWSGAWCLFSQSSRRLDWRLFRGCYSAAAATAAGRTPGRFSATARRWSRRGHVLIQPRRCHILLILFQLAAAQSIGFQITFSRRKLMDLPSFYYVIRNFHSKSTWSNIAENTSKKGCSKYNHIFLNWKTLWRMPQKIR